MKIVRRVFLGFIALLLLYLGMAFLLSVVPTLPKKLTCKANKSIYVTTNGIHLDIVMPKAYLPNEWKNALAIKGQTGYVAFAWGDKGFYLQTPTWSEFKLTVALKALFFPSESAMHVSQYPSRYTRWHQVLLCEAQLESLLAYIHQSFKKDEQGKIFKIEGAGYTANDAFFEANGKYTCFYTCNNWVNQALKKAEIETAVWSPFDKGVLHHIE